MALKLWKGWPRVRSILCVAGLFIVGGCGGTTPPAESVDSSAVQSKSEAAQDKAVPLPPLEPADAPGGLVFQARVKSPGDLLDGLLESAAVPFDWREALAASDARARMIFQEAIDLDGPVEALVALNPRPQRKPYGVVSVSARGVPRVLRALDGLQVEAQEGPGGIHYFSFEGQDCAVGRSLGPSRARVVCGDREQSLRELLPYALRGFPTKRLSDSSVHFNLDVVPIRRAYGKQLRSLKLLASVAARQLHLDHAKFDRAVTDTLTGLAEEVGQLARDLDSLEGQIREDEGGYQLSMTARFSGSRSWTSGAVSALAKQQDKAPDLFRQIPATATSASYSRRLPRRRTREISEILQALVGGYLEHEGVAAGTVRRVERTIATLSEGERPMATATGPLISEKEEGRTRLGSAWTLWGVQRPQNEVARFFDDISAILRSADVKNMAEGPKGLPEFKRKYQALRGVPGARLYQWSWPEMAEELEDLNQPGVDISSGTFESLTNGFVAFKEIEDVTWIATGSDVERLAEALRAVSAKDTKRLADGKKFDALFARPAVAAGFLDIEGIAVSFSPLFPEYVADNWDNFVRSTPHGGETPTAYFVEANGKDAREIRFVQEIPEELVVDLTSLAVVAASEK